MGLSTTKQVIVMRRDLKMRRGKEIAQGCHASLGAILDNGQLANNKAVTEWLDGSFTKICVRCESEEELLDLYKQVQESGILNYALITDAGHTEFNGVPTKTCLGIGPARIEDIDKITGHLKLL